MLGYIGWLYSLSAIEEHKTGVSGIPLSWEESAEDEVLEPPLIYTADAKGGRELLAEGLRV